MNYEKTLAGLCALPGPSGFEGQAARAALELLRPLVDEAFLDRMGSVVGVLRCGREGAKKVLLDAHLDEIGFLITGHEEGFLRFAPLGGVDPRMLPDRELTILTQPPVVGVVSCLPPHIQSREDMDQSVAIQDLYLDVGLDQETARARIPVGTPAVYRAGCTPLGDKLLCGKALDDRACFAILLDALERLRDRELDVDLYVLGSTQEETHSTGAIAAAYGIAPDCCVAVDVTHGDSPDASKDKTFQLDVQLEVMAGSSGTNGWPMQISREGIATAVLSLPLRYMHTPIETVHRDDLDHTAQLLAAFLEGLGEEAEAL